MRIRRSASVLTAVLAVMLVVMLASSLAHAQTQTDFQSIPTVKPADVTVEPVSVEPVGVDDLSSENEPLPNERFERGDEFDEPDGVLSSDATVSSDATGRDRQAVSSALLAQVEAEIAEAESRVVDFASAFEKAQRQFVEGIPGRQVAVPPEVLERFDRDLGELERRFSRVETGFDEIGQDRQANRARDALSAIESLRGQLALLGLRLETRGERARVANALEFDFELLVVALSALHGPVVIGDREFDDDIIRPPEGVSPTGVLIRPPEGIEPSHDIIRPPEGIEPSDEIIRPPEGIAPSDAIIRPPQGITPSREIIRPPEGIAPSREIIRPPTSDNPAVSE